MITLFDSSPLSGPMKRSFNRLLILGIFLFLGGCKIVVVNLGGGTIVGVTQNPQGDLRINCGTKCDHSYGGLEVAETLTATPAPNHVFDGWFNGPCTGTGTCELVAGVDGKISVEGRFRYSALSLAAISDQTLTQDFAAFNLQADASVAPSEGAISYGVSNASPDVVDVQIDTVSGEITVSPVSGKFGRSVVHVTASVAGGDAHISFLIDIPMPENPIFACGTGTDTLTEEDLPGSYTLFESGQTRPLALSPNGQLLFVANTPANCLEIYSTENDDLTLVSSVSVGLEPIAVAARSDTEIWVVNHLSDSVSVVDIRHTPRVIRTLLVGDEPRDIVFGGTNKDKAFISAAFRGQNHPTYNPETHFRTPGIGRMDVWVFNANNLGVSLGGAPTTILNFFADSPRSLAVTPDGLTVYAAGFFSGNQTTSVLSQFIGGSRPPPLVNTEGIAAPLEGLIVKYNGTNFVDENNVARTVFFTLPDRDVFVIDATTNPPTNVGNHTSVGTTLFNMAVHPVDGRLFVANTEARNHVRFEGPGILSTTVRGHAVENRITVIDGSSVTPRHLNKHVDFSLEEGAAIPVSEKARSLAQPGAMAFDALGNKLYVAAFGSNKVGVFNADALADDSFVPGNNIDIPGGGPSGLVYKPNPARLYVYSRFDNSVSVVRLADNQVVETQPLFTPEAADTIAGRPFLYDADLTSSNGTQSCGSCHVFGDFDNIGWDLGNPDDVVKDNPNPFILGGAGATFHPMKGPMTTQTLRGIGDSGPLHWRGDRTGRDAAGNPIPGETIESAAFKEFNPAFVGLVGRQTELSEPELQSFTDFALKLALPPNPLQNLDNSLTPSQAAGRNTYLTKDNVDGGFSCDGCHTLDESQNFFGTSGESTFEGRVQEAKVPHLRNAYTKVGMFFNPGEQMKGFGYLHGGDVPSVDFFVTSGPFALNATEIRNVVNFTLAFPSTEAPVVGQQITLTSVSGVTANDRVNLLIARALAGDADLIVKGVAGSGPVSARLLANGNFLTADGTELTDSALRGIAGTAGQELTYTAVPLGHAERLAPLSGS